MSHQVHVCHVTTVHRWSDSRIFDRLCVGLVGRGYRVTLVAPVDAPREERGVQLIPTGLVGKWQRLVGIRALLRVVRRVGAHLYQFHDPELLPWMPMLRTGGARVVYDVHEYYPETVVHSNYFGWRPVSVVAGEIFRWLEPALARRVDAVVGVTAPIVDRLVSGSRPSAVIPNVPPYPFPRSSATPELPSSCTLVVGGVLDESRCMPQMVQALGILAKRRPDISLLCFGNIQADPSFNRLRRHAAAAGVADRLILREWVPWATYHQFVAASPVGLVLLDDRQNNRWSLPNRLFDFMGHGVPIVATDLPLLRSMIREADCGILLRSPHPSEIAAAVESLLGNPAEAARLGANGRRAVQERYNWGAALDRLESVYRAVLSATPGSD